MLADVSKSFVGDALTNDELSSMSQSFYKRISNATTGCATLSAIEKCLMLIDCLPVLFVSTLSHSLAWSEAHRCIRMLSTTLNSINNNNSPTDVKSDACLAVLKRLQTFLVQRYSPLTKDNMNNNSTAATDGAASAAKKGKANSKVENLSPACRAFACRLWLQKATCIAQRPTQQVPCVSNVFICRFIECLFVGAENN
jgi:hypothetical protein